MRQTRLSIIAGLMTAVALVLLWSTIGTAVVENDAVFRFGPVGASILLVLGVSAWNATNSGVYGATVALAFSAAGIVMVGLYGGGNLAGFVVFLFTAAGAVLGGIAAFGGRLLHSLTPPHWLAPSAVTAAIIVMVGIAAYGAWVRSQQDVTIIDRIQDIRRAELAYAEHQPDGAFTCDGYRLPGLSGIEWRSSSQLGTTEKNQARIEGHEIYLRCEVSAKPQWVDIQVVSQFGLNSNTHVHR
jgi:hypothetical protein